MGVANEVADWDDDAFELSLRRATEGHIEAPSVRLGAHQLQQLLAAAPRDRHHPERDELKSVDFRGTTFTGAALFDGASFTGAARFDGASFTGNVGFGGASFSDAADFVGASFSQLARFGGASFTGNVGFGGASFSGNADFVGASFGGNADFAGARFSGDAGFARASFSQLAVFGGASFSGDARFGGASFSRNAVFGGASFSGDARFAGASFSRNALFDGASVSGVALFDGASFSQLAVFGGASFSGVARFVGASFSQLAVFDGAGFSGVVLFDGARFEAAGVLGPLLVCDRLSLDGAVFVQRVGLIASARRASFTGTEFRRGADLRLRWAEVWFEDTDFGEEALLALLLAPVRPESDRDGSFLGLETLTADRGLQLLRFPRAAGARGSTGADSRWLQGGEIERYLGSISRNAASRPHTGLIISGLSVSRSLDRPAGGGGHNVKQSPRSTTGGLAARRPQVGIQLANLTMGGHLSRRASCDQVKLRACTGSCARVARTAGTSPARTISTTARWRCAGTAAAGPSG